MSTGSKGPKDQDPMLDLPLREGQTQAQLPFGPDSLRGDPTPAPPRRRSTRAPRPRRRGLWLVVSAVLLILAVSAFLVLWPKPPIPGFSADPFVLDKVRVGASGQMEELTITNVGERPMPIQLLNLVDSELEEFALVEDNCGGTILEPQQSCGVQIRMAPTAMGIRQASLEVHAEMPKSPAVLAITGEGVAPVMSVSPPAGEFGDQEVGQLTAAIDLVVVNSGTAPMEVSRVSLAGRGEGDFRLTRNDCSRATLAPAETCRLEVAFSPRAAGRREAEIVIESDALEPVPRVRLSGDGIWTGAAFEVEPRSIDFGSHLVGTARRGERVQIINRQAMVLSGVRVALSEADRGFTVGRNTCAGADLAPGSSCSVDVQFDAPAEGEFATLLEIGQRQVGSLGVEIRGRGVAPRWVLARELLEFDDIRVGQKSAAAAIELRNEGSAAAKVTASALEGADTAAFRARDDRCRGRTVEPGSACSVGVEFEPQREGEHRARLVLEVEAGSGPQHVDLAARATAPRLNLDMELINFDQVHRTTRRQAELTVTNSGSAPLTLERVAIEGGPGSDFQILGGTCRGSQQIPVAGRCSLVVGFSPTTEGRGTDRLIIEHDGISGPRGLPLAGVGLPPPVPRIVIAETSLDFGPQPVGNRSPIETITIRAAGTGNLELEDFRVEGEQPNDFVIVPATCHAAPILLPGSDCALGVRFVPTAPGSRSARLIIIHNAGAGASRVELTGEGLGSLGD